MKVRIGIDVGKDGGIVAIISAPDGTKNIRTAPTPNVNKEIDMSELKLLLESFIKGGTDILIAIEAVSSIYGSSARSNFQFGRSLGILEGLVVGMGVPFIKIHAKKWQKVFFEGIPATTKPEGRVDTKQMAAQACKRLYPSVNLLASKRCKVPHKGIVDSLGIAHYINLNY